MIGSSSDAERLVILSEPHDGEPIGDVAIPDHIIKAVAALDGRTMRICDAMAEILGSSSDFSVYDIGNSIVVGFGEFVKFGQANIRRYNFIGILAKTVAGS